MYFRPAADLVVLLHFAFILFVLFGGLLALRWRKLPWLHLPAVLWGVLIEFTGGVCPLTPLENGLRRLAGESGYRGGFVEEYLVPIIYPAALSPEFQFALAAGVVLVNLAVYAGVILRNMRGERKA